MTNVDWTARVYPPVLQNGTLYVGSGRLSVQGTGDLAAVDPDSGTDQ